MAVSTIKYLCRESYSMAIEKGWFDDGERNTGELIALCHSELSEALEALRDGNPPDSCLPHLSLFESEIADLLLRVFTMMEYLEYDIEQAVMDKLIFNSARPGRILITVFISK